MDTPIIEMTHINKSFFGVPVLNDVDLAIQKGKIHALVGGNGAGKSTLVKILTGVYQKDSGNILFEGEPIIFQSYKDASDKGIRMIFQETSSVATLTVAQNIFLNNEINKGIFLNKKKMNAIAKDLLSRLKINIDPEEKVENLGVGYRQMIEIAKALSQNAKILIMDEPTASLSDSEVKTLFGIVKTIKENGVAIVYISHRMHEILEIADEITILRDGVKVATGPRKEFSLGKMISTILGKTQKQSFYWREPKYSGPKTRFLEVENLNVNQTISNISFHVNKGEVLGIAGLMNSGRTEILETIFGVRKKINGRVLVGKNELKRNSISEAVNYGIGLIPEDRRNKGLITEHSIKQNIAITLFSQITGRIFLKEKKLQSIAKKSVSDFHIKTDSIDKIVNFLSGGNQQKVVFSKWIRANTKILLLDEPTVGIDIGAKSEMIDLIRDFANEGGSVVFVSSEIPELLAVCDRLVILKKGKITDEYERSKIKSEEFIQHAIQ
jgi:ribose transport system ATP-binding protein